MRTPAGVSIFAVLALLLSANAHSQQGASYTPAAGSYTYGGQSRTYGYAGSTFGSPLAFGASGGSVGIGVFALRDAPKHGGGHFDDGSAGITLGPALTFGYIAGRDIAQRAGARL